LETSQNWDRSSPTLIGSVSTALVSYSLLYHSRAGEAHHLSSIETNLVFCLDKVIETIFAMDDKIPVGSVGDLELTDQVAGASPNAGSGGHMTRDEGEMAFYGKKQQLKVRVLDSPFAATSRY
jgi:hypothetical protein